MIAMAILTGLQLIMLQGGREGPELDLPFLLLLLLPQTF